MSAEPIRRTPVEPILHQLCDRIRSRSRRRSRGQRSGRTGCSSPTPWPPRSISRQPEGIAPPAGASPNARWASRRQVHLEQEHNRLAERSLIAATRQPRNWRPAWPGRGVRHLDTDGRRRRRDPDRRDRAPREQRRGPGRDGGLQRERRVTWSNIDQRIEPKAWSRSSSRSSGSSRPDREPDGAVGDADGGPASGVSRRCVVVAGWVTSDFASPRLFEMSTSRSASSSANAAVFGRRRADGGELERHDRRRRRPSAAWPGRSCGWLRQERVAHAADAVAAPPATAASRSARAHWCSTRSRSVSRPLSSTHALNGLIDGPVCRMSGLHRPVDVLLAGRGWRRRARGPGRRCAWSRSRRRCRRLSSSGCCSTGVANTLSTTTSAPAACASSQTARDVDEVLHRVGRRLEEHRLRRRRRARRATGRGRAPSTKSVSIPHRGRISSRMTKHEPNSARAATTPVAAGQDRGQRGEHRRHARRGGEAGLARPRAGAAAPRTSPPWGCRSGSR